MASRLLRAIIMGPPGSGKGTISSRIIKDFDMKHLSSGDLLRSQIINKTSNKNNHKSLDDFEFLPDPITNYRVSCIENLFNVVSTIRPTFLIGSFSFLQVQMPVLQAIWTWFHLEQSHEGAGLLAKEYIDHGNLVPDDVIVDLIINELHPIQNHSWLLDGFPRTLPQAKALYEREPLDLVINLNVPFSVIIDRIKGRWTHAPSGRIYHTEFNPPKVEGIDDVTGERLIQREDDKPETVEKRLDKYQQLTQPVLEFFRNNGLLEEFTGKYSNEIWPRVHKYLSTRITPLQYTEYK